MTTRILPACLIAVVCASYCVIGDDRSAEKVATEKSSIARDAANRIELELQHETSCSMTDLPLEEALESLSTHHAINIWIDKQALQDERINSDTQVSLVISGITLEAALRLLLDPLALTFVASNGVLRITTQTKAEEMMSTRVFPVADLVSGGNYGSLMQAIMQATNSKWEQMDGEGGAIIPIPNVESLVIRQNQKAHREIEGLLAALRKVKQLRHIRSIPVDPGESDELSHVTFEQSRSATTSEAWRRPRIYAAE